MMADVDCNRHSRFRRIICRVVGGKLQRSRVFARAEQAKGSFDRLLPLIEHEIAEAALGKIEPITIGVKEGERSE